MSNQMSSSKSRRKGALLAAIAGAALMPVLAKAQTSMQVGIYLNPIGTTPSHNAYIDPFDPVTMYVYATVNGTSSPSVAYTDGVQYLYYNVNGAWSGNQSMGSITSTPLIAPFTGGNYNGMGATAAGAQNGVSSPILSTPGIVVGDASTITNMIKPRSPQDALWNSSTGSAPNVVVNGNSVSFLVQELVYQPNTTAINNYFANVSPSTAAANPNTVSFNISVPSVSALAGNNYQGSNWFVGVNTSSGLSNQGITGSAGSANTSTGYSSTGTTVSLTDALPGDINLDGAVNNTDLQILGPNYNQTIAGGWSVGDLNEDGSVNNTDLQILGPYYNQTLVPAAGSPAGQLGFQAALIADGISAVPEPTTGLLFGLGLVGMLGRRRKA